MNIFKNKKIIITGHTGFKGSWLTLWLQILGAKVYGISLHAPSIPSHYKLLKLKNNIFDIKQDVRDNKKIKKLIYEIQPDFLFHLAAQPIVRESYLDPQKTFTTNALGTLNVLEGLMTLTKKKCTAIIVTSDKCYENLELSRGYNENDKLGGSDPYSASKAVSEIIASSYFKSFISKKNNINMGIGRAGNVIGGGDWAENRIIPDCMKSWINKTPVILRNPKSTRPWQHVLEPLSGYLSLAVELNDDKKNNGESFNFGPPNNYDFSVLEVVKSMSKHWDGSKWKIVKESKVMQEAKLLKLNCAKAKNLLSWRAALDFNQTTKMTVDWYNKFSEQPNQVLNMSTFQIEEYTDLAKLKNIKWTKKL